MKKYSLLVSYFFVFFSFSAFAVDGYWEQVFPEKSPPARFAHVMASIGDRKVLMINGEDEETFFNDTWLYDYDSNTWQQIFCVTPRIDIRNRMCRISKNRVLWTGLHGKDPEFAGHWIFDLDSMKWFELDLSKSPEARQNQGMSYFKEDTAFLYGSEHLYRSIKYRDTWLASIETEDYESPYFINWNKVNDGDEGDDCPDNYYNNGGYYYYEGHKFDYLNKDMPILFIPEYAKFHFLFFHPEDRKWKHLKLGEHEPPPMKFGGYCNLTENIILGFGGYTWEDMYGVPICDWTCLMVYTSEDSTINTYQLNLSDIPQSRVSNACAKIDDGIAMMFGGQYLYYENEKRAGYDLNDTWIFHLTDKTDPRGGIHENTDTIDIRLISNNIYELSVACKVELYDMVGRNITTPSVEAPATPSGKGNCIIDLNGLPVGIYLLKYFHKSNWHVAKLVRY